MPAAAQKPPLGSGRKQGSDADTAAVLLRDPLAANLDLGERSLWAHALTRADAWVLCGPDKASLRFGVRLGFRDRLVALEGLFKDAGHKPGAALKENYTSSGWIRRSAKW